MMIRRITLASIVVLLSSFSLGQDVNTPEATTSEPIVVLSAQTSSIVENQSEQTLIALAPYSETEVGACSVISNMLADFCQNYPGDSSCQH